MSGKWQLELLGWREFQNLCSAVLASVFGQSVEAFEDGNDAGRDGAFKGRWRDGLEGEDLSGTFVAQMKFTSVQGATLGKSDLSDEFSKIRRLVDKGLCDVYVLMTNARVTGASNAAIKAAILEAGAKQVRIWGRTWIESKLDSDTSLRRMVPRVYGIGDLTEILDERQARQANRILSYLGPQTSTFVATEAYAKANNVLHEHHAVMLVGGPTVGKSVIAQMLTLGALDALGVEAMKPTTAQEFLASWNPTSAVPRIYWIDDAFGELSMDSGLVSEWTRRMPSLLAARADNYFIFTSRDYIYRDARSRLKESQYRLWADSRVEVRVAELDGMERKRILYSHLKLGNQPIEFKRAAKPHLDEISELDTFTPGLAFRLGNHEFTASVEPHDPASIRKFFDHPSEYLAEILSQLPRRDQAALAFLFSVGGELITPIQDASQAETTLGRLGSTTLDLTAALHALDGTFVHGVQEGHLRTWRFAHPTIRQATTEFLQSGAGALDVLVEGMNPEELLSQVDLRTIQQIPPEQRGRYLAVGPALADRTLAKLVGVAWRPLSQKWRHRDQLADLLVNRAGRESRALYVQFAGEDLKQWIPQYEVAHSSSGRLYDLLHQEGLLPDAVRQEIAGAIRDAAERLAWSSFSSPLLTAEERADVFFAVRASVVTFTSVIAHLSESYESSWDPDSYLEDNYLHLDGLRDRFCQDDEALAALLDYEIALESLRDELHGRYSPDYDPDYEYDRLREERLYATEQGSGRSIFDDLDS